MNDDLNESNGASTDFGRYSAKKKRAGKVKKASVIVFSVIAMALVAVLAVSAVLFIKQRSSRKLTDYEIASRSMNERERLVSFAVSEITKNDSLYESSQIISETVGSEIRNGTLSVSDRGDGLFVVSVNGIERFILSVGDVITGKDWEPVSCSFGYSLSVDAPHGSDVFVNGTRLSGGSKIVYPRLSPYEEKYSDTYLSDRYSVGPLYGNVNVTASLNGEQLIGPSVTSDSISFGYPLSSQEEYTVIAPVGTDLVINGVPLLSDAAKSLQLYPYLSRFEEGLDDELTAFSVSLGRLFESPEVEAFCNGKKLEQSKDGLIFLIPKEKMHEKYTVKAPSGYTVTMNGISAGNNEIVSFDVPPVLIDGCDSYMTDAVIPTDNEYEISGLFHEPVIRCYSPDGTETEPDEYLSAGHEYVFRRISSGTISSADIKTVSYFAKYYVRYVYNASLARGSNYNTLRAMAPSGSPASRRVQNMWNVVYYNTPYSSIKFGTLTYEDYYEYKPSVHSVTVIIPFTGVNGGVRYTFEMRLEVLYDFNGKIRRILNFNELTENSDLLK